MGVYRALSRLLARSISSPSLPPDSSQRLGGLGAELEVCDASSKIQAKQRTSPWSFMHVRSARSNENLSRK